MNRRMTRAGNIALNFLSLVSADMGVKAIGVISTAILARVIGPGHFGLLNLALVAANYFTLSATWGLPAIGVREISAHKHSARPWTRQITRVRLALAALSFLLLALWLYLFPHTTDFRYLTLAYGLTIFTSVLMLEWPFQGLEQMHYISAGRIVSAFVYLIGILLAIHHANDYFSVPWILVASHLSAILILSWRFFKTAPEPLSTDSPPHPVKVLIREAVPIGLSIFLSTLLLNADTLLIGFLRTDAEVGFYSGAYKIVLVFAGIMAAFSNAVFPSIAYYSRHDREKLETLLRYMARLLGLVLFPVMIGGMFLAEPVMKLLYGYQFIEGGAALRILMVSIWLSTMNSVYFFVMISRGENTRLLRVLMIQVATNLTLNLALIPVFGISGAAAATLISDLVGYVLFRKMAGVAIPIRKPFHKVWPACLFMAAALAVGRFYWVSAIWLAPLAAIVYGLSLFLTRGITREDVEYAIHLFRGERSDAAR